MVAGQCKVHILLSLSSRYESIMHAYVQFREQERQQCMLQHTRKQPNTVCLPIPSASGTEANARLRTIAHSM
eukprot:1161795-Pelagomonas_calceolata.AAC.3